jgi:hypothetical protein
MGSIKDGSSGYSTQSERGFSHATETAEDVSSTETQVHQQPARSEVGDQNLVGVLRHRGVALRSATPLQIFKILNTLKFFLQKV